jgi:hypothetical protein
VTNVRNRKAPPRSDGAVRSLERGMWPPYGEHDPLGYDGAWKAVRRCLSRRQDLAAQRYVATSLVDLDCIQERAWPSAMSGDLAAATVVLRVIEDRWRLAQLLASSETRDGKRAEPPAVAPPASPKRRPARKPEAGFFCSLDV